MWELKVAASFAWFTSLVAGKSGSMITHSVLLFSPAKAKLPQGSLHALDLSPTKTFLAELRSPPVPQKRLPIPKRLVEQVEELLKDNPAGLWVSRFPMEFKV